MPSATFSSSSRSRASSRTSSKNSLTESSRPPPETAARSARPAGVSSFAVAVTLRNTSTPAVAPMDTQKRRRTVPVNIGPSSLLLVGAAGLAVRLQLGLDPLGHVLILARGDGRAHPITEGGHLHQRSADRRGGGGDQAGDVLR